MPLLLVMLGGALGAGVRYLVGRGALLRWGPDFSFATLAVNIVGGLLMGCLVGLLARGGVGEGWRLFAGVGVLGGFTTFSAFSLESVTLLQRGQALGAIAYVVASVAGSMAALTAGMALTRGPA